MGRGRNLALKGFLKKIFGKASVAQLDLFAEAFLPPPTQAALFPLREPAPLPAKSSRQIEPPAGLEILYAPRLRKGWRVEWRMLGSSRLTLPRYMQSDSFRGVRALIFEWCLLVRKRKTAKVRADLKALETSIWKACEVTLAQEGTVITTRGDRLPPIRTQGKVHDLLPHFNAVNERYFAGVLQCSITWSGRAGGLSFHSKRKDPKTKAEVNLVSISRGYDFENCPAYALQGIIYHECLHIAVPPQHRAERRVVHGRDFRLREKQFEHFEEWKRWHAEILPRNVRALQRTSRK